MPKVTISATCRVTYNCICDVSQTDYDKYLLLAAIDDQRACDRFAQQLAELYIDPLADDDGAAEYEDVKITLRPEITRDK